MNDILESPSQEVTPSPSVASTSLTSTLPSQSVTQARQEQGILDRVKALIQKLESDEGIKFFKGLYDNNRDDVTDGTSLNPEMDMQGINVKEIGNSYIENIKESILLISSARSSGTREDDKLVADVLIKIIERLNGEHAFDGDPKKYVQVQELLNKINSGELSDKVEIFEKLAPMALGALVAYNFGKNPPKALLEVKESMKGYTHTSTYIAAARTAENVFLILSNTAYAAHKYYLQNNRSNDSNTNTNHDIESTTDPFLAPEDYELEEQQNSQIKGIEDWADKSDLEAYKKKKKEEQEAIYADTLDEQRQKLEETFRANIAQGNNPQEVRDRVGSVDADQAPVNAIAPFQRPDSPVASATIEDKIEYAQVTVARKKQEEREKANVERVRLRE
jgi:hypothetical protein